MRVRNIIVHTIVAAAVAIPPCPAAAAAKAATPVSEIVIDAQTGRSLYAANAARRRPPASLAKVMTLLLVFDALRSGRLDLDDDLVMTAAGERQAPSRLGLARGKTIPVSTAIRVVAVISANDVAVALADRLGGSEAKFVLRMNQRAAEIGMTDTRFGNATGLAPGAGFTTARDMAVLARYVVGRYPERYRLFGTRSIRWKGWTRPNHNQLLGRVEGVDGMKTGYTVAAGFNLVASARRGKTRVIVVVMGARTGAARDLLVANLLESGFTSSTVIRRAQTGREAKSKEPARSRERTPDVTRRRSAATTAPEAKGRAGRSQDKANGAGLPEHSARDDRAPAGKRKRNTAPVVRPVVPRAESPDRSAPKGEAARRRGSSASR